MKIQAFNIQCQGESHKRNDDKPCQDYSISFVDNDVAIAIISDGHGGERYFRSHFGSKFASKIAFETIKAGIIPIGGALFEGKCFTQVGISKERRDKPIDKNIERMMQHLFASIITQWYDSIQEHARNHPLDEWEEKHVPEKYKKEFNEQNKLEKNYGCTLMVYVQTSKYWFAFHLGDGKCISFHLKDDKLVWQEPILWDDACFLNETTSMSDSNAIEEFRYSYCGDGTFPFAVFLGSDGVDDSYGTTENLSYSFYIQLLQEMANKTTDDVKMELEKSLPEISKKGSQDDMSVAGVYDKELVVKAQKSILNYQIEFNKEKLIKLQDDRNSLIEKQRRIESQTTDRVKEVELKYVRNDIAKLDNEIKKIEEYLSRENLMRQNEQLQHRNENLENDCEQLKSQNERIEKENSNLRVEISELNNENSKLRSENSNLRVEKSELTNENYRLRSEKSNINNKCYELSKEKKDLMHEVNDFHSERILLMTLAITLFVLCVVLFYVFVLSDFNIHL